MQNTDRLCMGCMNDNGGERLCPICGYDGQKPQPENALPTRSWIGEGRYLMGKVMEQNGEGITYLGWDNTSDTIVWIREYFPAGLCERLNSGGVRPLLGSEEAFQEGKATFLKLNQALSRLRELPCLLPVTDLFEGSGTVYCVKQAASGITLREFLLRNGGTLKWEQARPLFLPLLSALKALHNAGVVHRGISPDTLLVGRDGKIRLKDFLIPAARTARSDMTAQLYPGFAAIEQYGFDGQPGPWTDVYGFAATLFRVLVGNPPPEATERVTDDHMTIPAAVAQTLPRHVLSALANALQILPEDRTQSMDELREDLVPSADAGRDGKKKKPGGKRYGLIAALTTAGVIVVVLTVLAMTVFRDDLFPTHGTSSGLQPPSMGSAGNAMPDESSEKLYSVPNILGQTFAQLTGNIEYQDIYEFEIVSESYNDTQPRGAVYEQSPAEGTTVSKGTKIQVRISLGPSVVALPPLVGLTREAAYIQLLEMGFMPGAVQFYEKYDASKPANTVVEVDPGEGTQLNPESGVKLFVNSFVAPPSQPETTTTSRSIVVTEPPTTTTEPATTTKPSTTTTKPSTTTTKPSTTTSHSSSSSEPEEE
ncbi:MAG: PASTA domain-containing protein [Clostridiales bacterium]|nr:PASTA domain-containing protein [Clostridiales bacterium]